MMLVTVASTTPTAPMATPAPPPHQDLKIMPRPIPMQPTIISPMATQDTGLVCRAWAATGGLPVLGRVVGA